MTHRFGGKWTEEKLKILEHYLSAYLKIFHANPRAQYLRTTYVDAFAGTGTRADSGSEEAVDPVLLPLEHDEDAKQFKRGSASIALEMEPSFHNYVFIEKNRARAGELEEHVRSYGHPVGVIPGEANAEIRAWIQRTHWHRNRAVVFLDPYGMQVEWDTIRALGGTHGVDLWLLFPLGQAVVRLLTERPPTGGWADRLTTFFGTEAWREAFYRASPQASLFGAPAEADRDVDWRQVESFFVERLKTVFAAVSQKPRRLMNSMSVPLYLLFFASANPKGSKTAIKIANHLLENI